MSPVSRDRKVLEMFQTALETPPGEWEAMFAASSGEPDVVAEVRELLAAHESVREGSFLASPAIDDYLPLRSRIGTSIGRYRIEAELGEGGMGMVYLASRSDGEYQNKVAIKLVKGGLASGDIVRRFRNERQILAALEHPNIGRLIDGGTSDDGLPYLVMEWVDGIPIDRYCRQNKLSIDQKLDLFTKVCSAVSHAHRNLIIHRDLKPSNILVTADGEPKLLDFGIAKLFSPEAGENDTVTNFRAFTPEYASPEQLKGAKLTTATDIYSLGVILYELIANVRPFRTDGKNFAEVLHLVSEVEPTRPSESVRTGDNGEPSLNSYLRSLRGDLDNIALKALKKEPERRYQTVDDLAEDIRRHRAGLPVSALPDTLIYRTQKFVRRNRIAVAAAVMIVIAIIGGLAATIWQFRKAQNERARAEGRFNDVRSLVNTFLSELNDEMSKVSGTTRARQLLVQRTLEYLDNASRESGGDNALRTELATAYLKIGDIQGNSYFQNLGDTSGALESYKKSLEIRTAMATQDPGNNVLQHDLAKTYESMADVVWDKGDISAAREYYQRAATIAESLSAASPGDAEAEVYLSQLYASLGDIKYNEGFQSFKDLPAALIEQHKALEIRERLYRSHPDDKSMIINLNQSYQRLGNNYRLKGDFDAEFEYLSKSEKLAQDLMAADPKNPNRRRDAAVCFGRLETYYLDADDIANARGYDQRSFDLREASYKADPSDVRAQRDMAFGFLMRGNLLTQTGDIRGALESYRSQLRLYENLAALDTANKDRQRDLIDGLVNAGGGLTKSRSLGDAIAHFERALEIARTFPADDLQTQANLALIYEGLGSAYLAEGKFDLAATDMEQAIAFCRSQVAADQLNVIARSELAKMYILMDEASRRSARGTPSAVTDWKAEAAAVITPLTDAQMLRKIDAKQFEKIRQTPNIR